MQYANVCSLLGIPRVNEMPIPPSLTDEEMLVLETSAKELIAEFRPAKAKPLNELWQPNKPVVASLEGSSIIGPIWIEKADPRTNRIIGRICTRQGIDAHFELDQHGSAMLDSLAERWASLQTLAGLSTAEAMRERLQSWCAAMLFEQLRECCVPFVLSALTKDLDTHEVWVQLSGIDVEHRFQLGKVELCGVSCDVIESWIATLRDSGLDSSALENYKAILTRNWQGQTAAVYKAYGDPEVVQHDAAEEAQRVCALIRASDPRGSSPTSRSFLQPIELRSQANIRRLLINPTRITCSTQDQPWDGQNAPTHCMTITRANLAVLWSEGGLASIHDLLSSNCRSAFQRDVLRSLLIYSRQHLTVDPVEKTLFTISALETLLFAGQPRVYQDTAIRRISGLLAGAQEMNEHVQTNVAAAYRFRNRFLHHGHNIADIEKVEAFLIIAWLFFSRVLASHDRWPTAKIFCDILDEQYRERFGDAPPAS